MFVLLPRINFNIFFYFLINLMFLICNRMQEVYRFIPMIHLMGLPALRLEDLLLGATDQQLGEVICLVRLIAVSMR